MHISWSVLIVPTHTRICTSSVLEGAVFSREWGTWSLTVLQDHCDNCLLNKSTHSVPAVWMSVFVQRETHQLLHGLLSQFVFLHLHVFIRINIKLGSCFPQRLSGSTNIRSKLNVSTLTLPLLQSTLNVRSQSSAVDCQGSEVRRYVCDA